MRFARCPSLSANVAEGLRQLGEDEIPRDFLEALDDFENGRFVSMETVLNEVPPDA